MIAVAIAGCACSFHPPEAGGFNQVTVICNTFGYEGLYAHRAWVALAQDLSASGVAALRLDYPGQGDSVDLPQDAQAVSAWLGSLGDAIAWVRQQFPGVAVSLVGYRLGALLAAEVAVLTPGLAAVVLLAPVLSGKNYVRELTLATGIAPAGAMQSGVLQAGWWLSMASLDALATLDLKHLDGHADFDVLAITDGSSRVVGRLLDTLLQQQASRQFTLADGADLQSLRADAHAAMVPEGSFATVARWLAARPLPGAKTFDATALSLPPARLIAPGLVELPQRFGPQQRYFGITTQPAAVLSDCTCLLILNTGGNPRSGHNRLSVGLARELARQGIASFRIDLTGTGDTLPVERGRNQALYGCAPVGDVSAAIDYLEAQGWREIAVFGICSGAYLGLQAAIEEPRIKRLLMVNSQSFLWTGPPFGTEAEDSAAARKGVELGHLSRYRRIVFTADFWRRLARNEVRVAGVLRKLAATLALRLASAMQTRLPGWLVLAPRAAQVQRNFQALARRKLPILLAYSDTDPGLNELQACFGRGGQRLVRQAGVSIEIFAGADHTFTRPDTAGSLIQTVTQFLQQPAPKAGAFSAHADRADLPGKAVK